MKDVINANASEQSSSFPDERQTYIAQTVANQGNVRGTAFIGASGVSEGGVTVADLSESRLKAAVVAQAQRVIVPVDHSKVGLSDFVKVCELDEIDAIVTDQHSEYLESLCRAHSVELISAEAG